MRQRGVATVWQVSGASIAVFVALWLTPMTGSAETPEVSPAGANRFSARGRDRTSPVVTPAVVLPSMDRSQSAGGAVEESKSAHAHVAASRQVSRQLLS